MRRCLGRFLRHPALAAACLVLSLAAWGAQLARVRNVFWISPACSLEVGLGGGALWVWAAERDAFDLLGPGFHATQASPRAWVPALRIDRGVVISVTGLPGARSSIVNGVFVRLPAWIAGALLLMPAIRLAVRMRRRRHGHCACGYDLAGLAAARCPECGRATPSGAIPTECR